MLDRTRCFQLFVFFLLTVPVSAQLFDALPRHGYWGCGLSGPTSQRSGAEVTAIAPKTFAESQGLKKGDIIYTVNGMLISSQSLFHEVFYTTKYIKGGSSVVLDVLREGKLIRKQGTIPSRPVESFKGVVTEYKSVLTSFGYKVQVIITRPEGTTGKIPGVFFVRWMSCDPIEKPVSRKHGVAMLLEDFIQRSGYAVIRVEKPGLGDSEGPACYNCDFAHEVAAHQAAYKAFTELDFIDKNKVIVLAQSNGAAWAPLVVADKAPAAFVVSGGWLKTWYEHMLEYKRKDFEWNGLAENEVNRKMKLAAEFYTDYLITKKAPYEVLKQKPHLAEIWDDEGEHQWGLPASYLQQLQELNPAQLWKKANSPTYVFYGEYDIAMSESDHKKIAAYVLANGSSSVYEYIPKMDHSLFWFDTREKSMNDFYGSGAYDPALADRLFTWLKKIIQ
jgi:alpha-beta hydrolase superfamily lysophospholipase